MDPAECAEDNQLFEERIKIIEDYYKQPGITRCYSCEQNYLKNPDYYANHCPHMDINYFINYYNRRSSIDLPYLPRLKEYKGYPDEDKRLKKLRDKIKEKSDKRKKL